MKSSFIAFLLAFIFQQTQAVYFQFYTIMERCLLEDLPQHHHMLAEYRNFDADISGYQIRILDPNNKELLAQVVNAQKGKVSFTTKEAGSHKICFQPYDGQWNKERKKTRFSLKLLGGESNYDDLARRDHLTQLQLLILKLKEHAEDFIKMQEKNREDESVQVEQNQNVNERVIYTTVFQTLIILVSGLYQIYSLRKYFIQKKLL